MNILINLTILYQINTKDVTIIGIDPSINCTGVCVYDSEKNLHKYVMIVSKSTKKMKAFQNDYVSIIDYEKRDSHKGEYHIKEYHKSENIYDICHELKTIIEQYRPDLIQMEGISYGSHGSSALADLAGLNFAIRMMLIECGIDFNILAPTSIKKFAVGNGGAEKDVIIASWKKLDRNISDITNIKLDDLADSFFIAHYTD